MKAKLAKLNLITKSGRMPVFVISFAFIATILTILALASSPPVPAYKGIWLKTEEIANLPMSGPAWENLKKVADSDLGLPQLQSNANYHGSKVYGVALVYARTGDQAYREKARAGIMKMMETGYNEDATCSNCTGVLGVSRNVMSYVIAADLINLEQLNATDAAKFKQWLTSIRTKYLPGGRVHSLVHSNQNFGENFGTMAGASRIAADLYLGDDTDLAEAVALHKAYADRNAYPQTLLPNGVPNSQGWLAQYKYFEKTSDSDFPSWGCKMDGANIADDYTWVAINPAPCSRQGFTDSNLSATTTCSLDGAYVEDVSRDPSEKTLCTIPYKSAGSTYEWEAMSSITMQAVMLQRAGKDSLITYGNQALKRMAQFIYDRGIWDSGFSENDHIPWIINKLYSSKYPTKSASFGKMLGFTDWTHAPASDSSPTSDAQSPTCSLSSPLGGSTVSGTVNAAAASTDNVGIQKVEFKINDVLTLTDTDSPYSFSWDTTKQTNGYHVLSIRCYDAVGNSTYASAGITVDNPTTTPTSDTTQPTINIIKPAGETIVSGNVSISTSARDNVEVVSIEILIDNKPFASTAGSSLSTSWNTKPKRISNGSHIITARAKDAAGNIGTTSITVYVAR